jgi:adenine-specific DNA-methyltransferase
MKKFEADKTTSANILTENIERLKTLFPEAITEEKIDFNILKQLLGGAVDEREEKYGLNWHGKRRARQLALSPSTGTLRPCPEDSVDWDTTQNLMIEGDNLEVLKLLQKSYAGKVKLIYIDPPYNTGKDFVYPDDFQDNIKNYLELTGQVEGGKKISSNTEASGRFHTDWLNMMYPRLKLAKNLLSEEGVLFISIDDSEVMNLRAVLDDLFGVENFLALLPTIMNLKGNNDEFAFAGTHEYTIVFARDRTRCQVNEWPLEDEETEDWEEDDIGPFKRGANLKATGGNAPRERRPNLFFSLYVAMDNSYVSVVRRSPTDKEVFPRTDGKDMSWRWSSDKFASQPNDVLVSSGESGDVALYKKQRPALGDLPSKKPKTVFYKPEYSSGNGTAEIKSLMGAKVFSSPPKPLRLMRDFLLIGSNSESLIIDLTAGSGTTGHAVMAQNTADGGNRRCILVQLPEPLDPENKDQKTAAEFCDQLGKPPNIAELTKERLRRAGKKIREENPMFAGDLGFRVFKLDTTNIRAWEPDRENLSQTLLDSVEHLKTDRSESDILYELLLKLGLDLCVPMKQKDIAGKTVHSIGEGTLIVCLAPLIGREEVEPLALGIVEWHKVLAPAGETTVVFRDGAFEDDVAKTNLAAILQQHGLENVRSL